jgi:cytochrome P450 family 135
MEPGGRPLGAVALHKGPGCLAKFGVHIGYASDVSVATSQLPPGPRMPSALQTLGWGARPLPFMERCRERYGDLFTVRIRNEFTWVFLSDPEHVKQVFTGDPNVLRAGEANSVLEPVVGSRSVLLLDEPQHMRNRKLMLPPFHGERMQRYEELMVHSAREDIARWPVGEPFALMPHMQAITLDVIMRAVFGITEVARLEHVRELLRGMIEWTTDPRRLAMLALLGPARIGRNRRFRGVMDPVDDAILEEIRRRRAEPDLAEREDILSLLIGARYEDGSPMSDEDLRDELMTLLVAGHETTATSLSWAMERLLRHPAKLARLREEALAGESEEYLDAVIKETLRLRPVLPIVLRRLSEPYEIGGYTLPAGVAVAPCIYLMHRREDIYPDARAFLPERFLERPAGTYTWIPFGGGVRRCLGASFALVEMKRVLQTIVREVSLRAAEPSSERVVRRSITLNPQHGTRVVVLKRTPGEDAGAEFERALLGAAA